jgi:hypothetical protein
MADDYDEDDDRPRRRRARRDDDDEDDDDRPRARRRRDEDDDYDDEDDRPRRRRDDDEEGDTTGGLIPYKNRPALIGYYCGFLGLLPVLGLVLGPAAVVLGIMGLARARANPRVHGTAHAVVAIILGLSGFFLCSPVWLFIGWAALIGPK